MFSLIIKTLFVLTSLPVLSSVASLDQFFSTADYSQIDFPYSLGPKITAESALVVNLDEGQVCFSKNKDKVLPIASITKLMTALVFLEHNKMDWEEEIIIQKQDLVINSVNDSELKPVVLGFQSGQKMKLKDIFSASLIRSANDAVKVLTRLIDLPAGKTFVDLMNEKAEELGMKNTNFEDPTGLNIKNQSTSEDLVKLICAALKKDKISQALSKKVYDFPIIDKQGVKQYIRVWNTDELLGTFTKIKGAKTGYLDESGYCFLGLSNYQDNQLVIALLKSATSQDRFQEVKSLIYWSEENCQRQLERINLK